MTDKSGRCSSFIIFVKKSICKKLVYLLQTNIKKSLNTQLLCGFRLFILKKTVLEFGNTVQLVCFYSFYVNGVTLADRL